MEERKLNEKESLELIAQMIQNSKKNLQVGRGNQFILWGWLGAITSLAVMAMQIGRASCREECRSRWSPYH